MKETWEILANAFNSEPEGGVLICEFENNEIPRDVFGISIYPTMMFYKANDKENPILYESWRDLDYFE